MTQRNLKLSSIHSICPACWLKCNPDGRKPVQVADPPRPAICCFCGERHRSGIFVAEDGATLICRGECADD